MRKKIRILPASEIDLEFSDGTVFTATFNMLAVGYIQEVLFEYKGKINTTELGAVILYGAIKVNHKDYTMEEAKALAVTVAPVTLNEIIDEYTKSMGEIEIGETQKKTLMEMLLRLAK